MQHDEIVLRGVGRDLLDPEPVRRGIDELRALDEAAGWASHVGYQKDWISRARLVRAPAAVEPVERRRLQKKGPIMMRVRSPIRHPTPVPRPCGSDGPSSSRPGREKLTIEG